MSELLEYFVRQLRDMNYSSSLNDFNNVISYVPEFKHKMNGYINNGFIDFGINQFGGAGYSADVMAEIDRLTNGTNDIRSIADGINNLINKDEHQREIYKNIIVDFKNGNHDDFVSIHSYNQIRVLRDYCMKFFSPSRHKILIMYADKSIPVLHEIICEHMRVYDSIKYISARSGVCLLLDADKNAENIKPLDEYVIWLCNRHDLSPHEKLNLLYSLIRNFINTMATYFINILSKRIYPIIIHHIYIDNYNQMYILPVNYNEEEPGYVGNYYTTYNQVNNNISSRTEVLLTQCVLVILSIFRLFHNMNVPENISSGNILLFRATYVPGKTVDISTNGNTHDMFNYEDYMNPENKAIFYNDIPDDFVVFLKRYLYNILNGTISSVIRFDSCRDLLNTISTYFQSREIVPPFIDVPIDVV